MKSLQLAFAVSWASAIPLSGCLNNSLRNDTTSAEVEKSTSQISKIESRADYVELEVIPAFMNPGPDLLDFSAGRQFITLASHLQEQPSVVSPTLFSIFATKDDPDAQSTIKLVSSETPEIDSSSPDSNKLKPARRTPFGFLKGLTKKKEADSQAAKPEAFSSQENHANTSQQRSQRRSQNSSLSPDSFDFDVKREFSASAIYDAGRESSDHGRANVSKAHPQQGDAQAQHLSPRSREGTSSIAQSNSHFSARPQGQFGGGPNGSFDSPTSQTTREAQRFPNSPGVASSHGSESSPVAGTFRQIVKDDAGWSQLSSASTKELKTEIGVANVAESDWKSTSDRVFAQTQSQSSTHSTPGQLVEKQAFASHAGVRQFTPTHSNSPQQQSTIQRDELSSKSVEKSLANVFAEFDAQEQSNKLDANSLESLASRPATSPPTIAQQVATQSSKVDQHRIRINALLSEAHSNVIRGELHAAYRSALLAERIAADNQIHFQNGEENPKDYSREIAAKIWQASKPRDDSKIMIAQARPNTEAFTKEPAIASTARNDVRSDLRGETQNDLRKDARNDFESRFNSPFDDEFRVAHHKGKAPEFPSNLSASQRKTDPSIQVAARRAAEHFDRETRQTIDSTFGAAVNTWVSMPDDRATLVAGLQDRPYLVATLQGISISGETAKAAKSGRLHEDSRWAKSRVEDDVLPQIRPAISRENERDQSSQQSPVSITQDFSSDAFLVAPPPPRTTASARVPIIRVPEVMQEAGTVEFAIAHSMAKTPEHQSLRSHVQNVAETHRTNAEGFSRHTITFPDQLLAVSRSHQPHLNAIENLSKSGDATVQFEFASWSRLWWVVIGFVGAGAGIFLGLRQSRQTDPSPTTPASNEIFTFPQSDKSNVQVDDAQTWKSRRAA